jgi:hypothetical protein
MTRPTVPFAPVFTGPASAGPSERGAARAGLGLSEMLAHGAYRLVLAIESALDTARSRR